MAGESYAIPPKDRAVEGILWYIQHHQLASGDRLPAERVLCEEIGVSRTALRAGITRLISCGTLESRRGSGTYAWGGCRRSFAPHAARSTYRGRAGVNRDRSR